MSIPSIDLCPIVTPRTNGLFGRSSRIIARSSNYDSDLSDKHPKITNGKK